MALATPAISTTDGRVRAAATATRPFPPLPRVAYVLSTLLAVVAALTCAATVFLPGILRGPAVMNGSARGTALIALVCAVPTLAVAMWRASRGSTRAVIVWLGVVMYLAYNAVMLLLATPFNRLFLGNVAMMGLAIAAGIALVATVDVHELARRCDPRLPARSLAAFIAVIVVGNGLLWLKGATQGIIRDVPLQALAGTGLTTVPTWVQDLSFWLPLMLVGAIWLWRRRPWGYLIAGAGLVYWVLEGLTVATDQFLGHRADPVSHVVTTAAVPGFAVLATIALAAAWLFRRNVDRRQDVAEVEERRLRAAA
jgi:hypothetical protein